METNLSKGFGVKCRAELLVNSCKQLVLASRLIPDSKIEKLKIIIDLKTIFEYTLQRFLPGST